MRREPSRRRATASFIAALVLMFGTSPVAGQEEPPPEATRGTPPRLSFLDGPVSFYRPGAEDWTGAQINLPLSPGDQLYTGPAANLEVQIGPRAYVRAGAETQLGLENQDPDNLQFRMTAGHVSFDVRSMTAGHSIEIDTPNAAFNIDRTGYYRIDIDGDTTAFINRRGGRATMIPAGGEPGTLAPSEEVVIRGGDNPDIGTYAAPEPDDWDRWNYARTDHLIESVSARYVPPGEYGTEALDHYGDWRVVDPYGPVWVPEGVAPDWSPYSTGRWVLDPFYGWTWVDDAPWGWAPYHYGRWVHMRGFWGWAPGPIVAAPVYAPALVAFFHGPHLAVDVGIAGPGVGWVALGWGEPCIPWWGPRHFEGQPWWGGWGGPRIVNNVVVQRNTVVNVTNITYQNVNVPHAVLGAPIDRFGRGRPEHVRLAEADVHRLEPVRGTLPVKPVPASLAPATHRGTAPPPAVLERRVVATHPPRDVAADLRQHGLEAAPKVNPPAPRVVNVPRGPGKSIQATGRPPFGREGSTERPAPALPPRFGAPQQPAGQPPQAPGQPPPRGAERRVPPGRAPEQHAPAGAPPAASAPAPRIPGVPQQPAPAPQPHAPAMAPPAPPRAPAVAPPPAAHVPEHRAPAGAPPPPVPRVPEQHGSAPPPALRPPERAAPAPRVPETRPAPPPVAAPRQLPGEPASRLFRGAPAAPAQHPQAPPAVAVPRPQAPPPVRAQSQPPRSAPPPAREPQGRRPAPPPKPEAPGR